MLRTVTHQTGIKGKRGGERTTKPDLKFYSKKLKNGCGIKNIENGVYLVLVWI